MKVLFIIASLLLSVPFSNAGQKRIILSKDNTVVLDSQVDGLSVHEVISKARELDSIQEAGLARLSKDRSPIYLLLRTPGGDVIKGMELIDYLRGLKRPVHTVTMFAASMGFQTVQGLGTRYITGSGVLMSHRGYGGVEGALGGLRPSQFDSRANLWINMLDTLDKRTVARTKGKQTLASYQKAYNSELWIQGQDAVDQGYADEVVSLECDSSLSGTESKTQTLMDGLVTVHYEISNCPIGAIPLNVTAKLTNFRLSEIEENFRNDYLNLIQHTKILR